MLGHLLSLIFSIPKYNTEKSLLFITLLDILGKVWDFYSERADSNIGSTINGAILDKPLNFLNPSFFICK